MAFAVTAAHEAERAQGGAVVEDLAEEVLYWGCKQVDGNCTPGTSFASAGVALARWGQPDESLWPYDPLRVDTDASYAPPPAALGPSVCRQARLTQVALDIAAMRDYLARGRVVLLGLMLNDVFDDPPGGVIPMPQPGEKFTEAHALAIVGYTDGSTPGEGMLIVRNSWGPDWGDAGYGYLPYAYVRQYGLTAWLVGQR